MKMYYKDQNKKLSEKEWMESVINQMGFKTKRIDEQQPQAQPAQQQPQTAQQQPQAQPAAQSKTMTDFFTTINNMAKMLGGKTAVPVDPKQAQAFNTNLESLGKLFPVFQAEMKKSQQAQAKQAQAKQAPAPAPAPAKQAPVQPQAQQAQAKQQPVQQQAQPQAQQQQQKT